MVNYVESKKVMVIANFSLVFLALLLTLNLFNVQLPTVGQAQYLIDQDNPLCIVNYKDNFNEWNDLDSCCIESRKQLECKKNKLEKTDWSCQTGSDLKYLLNKKAYNYCQNLEIW